MKKNIIHRLTISFCTVGLGAGLALAAHPNVGERQINQQKRIRQGVNSGELTPLETARLERNSARIHRSIARDRRDGGSFTPHERAKARKKLNKQSRAINRQKHDRQRR